MKKFVPILLATFLLLTIPHPTSANKTTTSTRPVDTYFSWQDFYKNRKDLDPITSKKSFSPSTPSGKASFNPASKRYRSQNGKVRYIVDN